MQYTSFVIAHWLPTIGTADKIVLIDNGIVGEAGLPAELINHNGRYRKLNEMPFDFGRVTQSPAVEGLSASQLTPLEEE